MKVKGKQNDVAIFDLFDGDDEKYIEKKIETRKSFEQGIQLYYNKEFAEASVCFNNVLKKYPEDTASKLYINRSAH